MADELKQSQSQLARIVVPAITDVEYAKGLADAFNKINDNFKKIASLPFLQGVQGDSYQLEEYSIWEKDKTENWILTEDGKILLDSIFGIDTTKDGNSFNNIRECIGQIMPEENGVSPIDFFKNGNDIVNNSLYFYVIKDDTGNIIEKQLGQYYYFVDGRLKEIGNIYNSENAGSVLSVFNDYTGFYQYKYDAEDTENLNGTYIKLEILPTIYYDQSKNDICWKFNGNETGISAIGVKGADGKDADLSIVKVDLNNENSLYSNNSTSGKVVGILDTSANNGETTQWITDTKYFKTGKALIYMSGKIPSENSEESNVNPLSGETETNEITINDFAYGEIVKQDVGYIAYWEPNCVFSKIITNNSFTQYFYNMGSAAYTNNAPYFLAIPSIQNRDSSTEEAKQHAHIIKGYEGNKDNNIESLNIFHSDDAFDEVGNQNINAKESSVVKKLNIKNYDVNISKTLTTKGKIIGTGGLEVYGGANIKNGGITVGGTATFGGSATFKNDLFIERSLEVGESATFDSYLSIGGTLGVSGAATFKNDLIVSRSLGVGGTANIADGATIRNGATIYGTETQPGGIGLYVYGGIGATGSHGGTGVVIEGGKSIQNDGGVGLVVRGGTSINGSGKNGLGLKVESGGAEISNYLSVGGTLGVSKAAKFEDYLSVGGTLSVSGALGVTGAAKIDDYLRIGGTLGVTGAATFEDYLYVEGNLGVGETATFENNLIVSGIVSIGNNTVDSTSTSTGALIVSGGIGISKNLYTDGLNTNSLTVNKTLTVTGDNATINGVKILYNKVEASSGFFQRSDERLKNIIEPISVDLDKLSKLRKVYFKWKDNLVSNNEIGMIAQDIQKIYPELVYEDGGRLSLAYDKLSVIALEAIDVLNEKNKELEKRINKLESIILK